MTTFAGLLLAHQGGWDEALFVLAPLLLFAGLLLAARRRVDQLDGEDVDGDAAGPDDTGPDDTAPDGTGASDTEASDTGATDPAGEAHTRDR